MNQVIVVNNSLNIANSLCDILEKRDITVIKAGVGSSKPDFLGIDLVGYEADTVVCSDVFEREIGGSAKLVSIARQAKLTKIIIIVTRGITKKPQSVTLSTFHYMELVSTIDYYCQQLWGNMDEKLNYFEYHKYLKYFRYLK